MITIKKTETIEGATCDRCGKDLRHKLGGEYTGLNYGTITSHFGYGSVLDEATPDDKVKLDLCEECFARAVIGLGSKVVDMLDPALVRNLLELFKKSRI